MHLYEISQSARAIQFNIANTAACSLQISLSLSKHPGQSCSPLYIKPDIWIRVWSPAASSLILPAPHKCCKPGLSSALYSTSLQVREVLGRIDGRAVPPHVRESLLAGFLDLAGGMDDGLHELQVAAAQLGLWVHQPREQLAVLGLVDV